MGLFSKENRLFQFIAFVLIVVSAVMFWLSLILLQHPQKLTISTNQWYSLIFVAVGAIIVFLRYVLLIEPHKEIEDNGSSRYEEKLD